MNKQEQKWIRLVVQIIRKGLKTFYNEFLKPHSNNKMKEDRNENTKHPQNPHFQENYQDNGSHPFDNY
jgi:hypothetical protein